MSTENNPFESQQHEANYAKTIAEIQKTLEETSFTRTKRILAPFAAGVAFLGVAQGLFKYFNGP